MEKLSTLLSNETWTMPTGGVDSTLAIGLSFIFLAYILHPAIEAAYQRVRAYHAWRCIEKQQRVDVTTYLMLSELFAGRGRWDAARVITLLLLAFSLASWILELSMDLNPVDNPAHLLTQPPPVFKWDAENDNGEVPWHVLNLTEIDSEYQGNWWKLPNVFETFAKSRYYVQNDTYYAWSKRKDRYIDGEIIVASWSPEEKPDSLIYGQSATVMVDGITCSSNGTRDDTTVTRRNATDHIEEWGTVLECDRGPGITNGTGKSKPSIILTAHDGGDTHVIVEETSKHPSFLYSVWNATGDSITAAGDSSVEIAYAFHIASTVRLAEAVVTGIVNGVAGGGGGACFGLLRAYSKGSDTPEFEEYGTEKATPFGEDPENGAVDSLNEVEIINTGVMMNANAMVAFVWLLVLSFIGFGMTFFLRSKIDMDIYDRHYEHQARSTLHARKTPQGRATPRDLPPGAGVPRRPLQALRDAHLRPEGRGEQARERRYQRGRRQPERLLGLSHEKRARGLGRAFPGPMNNFIYPESVASSVTLSGSPVPLPLGPTTASPTLSPAVVVRGVAVPNPRPGVPLIPPDRGASVLFESVFSESEDDDGDNNGRDADDGDVGTGTDGGPPPGLQRPAFGGEHGGTDSRRGHSPSGRASSLVGFASRDPDSDATRAPVETANQGSGHNTGGGRGGATARSGDHRLHARDWTTPPPDSTGGSPVPSGVLTTMDTLGPPQMMPLTRASGEETKQEGGVPLPPV
ncbi:hypothetical protein Esi_0219_0035 [Ectocarpus siliculosus]|uniref:Uncharacterized protein n=1 Tax=Ectocarpus siliculosus TaxID=2880 RepID=D7FRU0_ECTSI|nr:hypothetical protein Esi_0219_0035 [Ectocarpus siliculosus]|eukprot:CBJ30881.1 hypothetical protein Esi_0219_0035 [Ectocarpus siliculosus]